MKHRTSSFLLLVCFSLLFINYSSSQTASSTSSNAVVFKPASFIVQLDFSFAQPLPNLYGPVGDFFQFKDYGVKAGVGSRITFKYPADKKGRLRPYLAIGYDLFLGSDNSTAWIGDNTTTSFPYSGDSVGTSTPGVSNIWIHHFSLQAGFEYAFTNKTRWTPFVDADLGWNLIFGTYRQTPISVPAIQTPGQISFTIKSANRFGFSIGSGVEGRVARPFGVVMGLRYTLPNVTKSSEISTEVNKFALNDAQNTSLNAYQNKSRNMDYLSVYAGVIFYMGKK